MVPVLKNQEMLSVPPTLGQVFRDALKTKNDVAPPSVAGSGIWYNGRFPFLPLRPVSSIMISNAPSKPTSLWNQGFIALLITQFMVSFNDNIFRWLIIPVGKYCDGWNTPNGAKMILTLGAVTFFLPFVVFTPWAGFCTDRFSRRSVMIWCKVAEIVILVGGIIGIYLQHVPTMLVVLCLLGIQGAFFSPSKYGSLPDLVPHDRLTEANGVIGMTTMIACVSGQVLGGMLFEWSTLFDAEHHPAASTGGLERPWIWAICLMGIAILGWISSFYITKLPPADPKAKFPWNPATQICRDIYFLAKLRWIFIPALGSAFFWGLGALAQQNVDVYSEYILHVTQGDAMYLMALLSFGIALGSILAGLISKRRIELGLVPLGAFGIGICGLLLAFTPDADTIGRTASMWTFSYGYGAIFLFSLGVCAGVYDIPMVSYIQEQSPAEHRGRVLAATNFFSFSAMLLFAGGVFPFLSVGLGFSANAIWGATCAMVLIVGFLLAWHFLTPLLLFVITKTAWVIYRPKIVGLENIPKEGGVLFVSNHVSYLDGVFLYDSLPKNVRFFAHSNFVPDILAGVARDTGLIRVLPGKKVVQALKTAREALKNGDWLGIFPEGGITRTGQIKAFEPGFLSILKGAEDTPIVPVHIGGLYGSMFSYKYGDKKFTFWPRKLYNDVIVSFGKPIYKPAYPMQVQRAVEELGVDTMREHSKKKLPIPGRILIRAARKRGRKLMFADSTGIELSGYKFLAAVYVFRKLLRRYALKPRTEEQNVGLLVPMSVGGSLLNAALTLDRRTPVNLNFTFNQETIDHCVVQGEIKHVFTSRKLLERFPNLKLSAEIICTEDLLKKATTFDRISCFAAAVLLPNFIGERLLGLHRKGLHEELSTIIYTSGSTGKPKGVMLTNNNLSEVGRSFVDAMRLHEKDTVIGMLPFFHAFGFMGNFWLPIFCGGAGAFHFSPLEPKKVGEMARKYAGTFFPSTPTFLHGFLKRCPKQDFENVHTVMCGAEKLPIDVMDAWQQKFGPRPGEGFGATELSPLPTTNTPDCRRPDTFNKYRKDGSIGRAVANIAVKIVDLDTGEDLPPEHVGMLVVKGPTVMKGYYKRPELTAEVIKDGWYTTGDVGKVDADGFFWITGRQSRISKIGGEMVPHILIEEQIQKIIAAAVRDQEQVDEDIATGPMIAVTAVPHSTKGEQIIVLHRPLPIDPEEIVSRMLGSNLPRIWVPHLDGFFEVESIPLLGTGKLDLAAIKQLALSKAVK